MNAASPSQVLGQTAKFHRLLEAAGLTPQLMQRVTERPTLRQQIIKLIETDMIKAWQPTQPGLQFPLREDRLHQMLQSIQDEYSQHRTTPDLTACLNEVVDAVEDQSSREQVVEAILKDRYAEVFIFQYGLGIDEPATTTQLAAWYEVRENTIRNWQLKGMGNIVYRLLAMTVRVPTPGLQGNSRIQQIEALHEAGLVTREWTIAKLAAHQAERDGEMSARATSIRSKSGEIKAHPEIFDIYELDLTVRGFNVLKRAGVHTVAELVNLTEEDLRGMRNMGQIPIDDIKLKLASHGLLLKDSPVSPS